MRQFLATESSLKMMENVFYITLKAVHTLKAVLILKISKILS